MSKFATDLGTAALAVAGGIFTSFVFVQVERMSLYCDYLSHSYDGHCFLSGADPFWLLPFSIWHTVLFVAAAFIGHRYWERPERSPFLLWQLVGGIVLLAWMVTLIVVTGLEYLALSSSFVLERFFSQFVSWSGFRYLTSIFAGNVIYASLMQGAAKHFAIKEYNSSELQSVLLKLPNRLETGKRGSAP